jgi:sulfur-carrier protein
MTVTVKLFASLRLGRSDIQRMEVPEASTPRYVIGRLAIPDKEVTLIFVNGRHGEPDTVLADGDTVALFPPVGGG